MKIFWDIAILSYACKGAHIFWGWSTYYLSVHLSSLPTANNHPPKKIPKHTAKEELYMYPCTLVQLIAVFGLS